MTGGISPELAAAAIVLVVAWGVIQFVFSLVKSGFDDKDGWTEINRAGTERSPFSQVQ